MNGLLQEPQFPRSNTYSPDWLIASASGGANPVWLAEWLSSDLRLKPGMNVLDLGCGRSASSIFLAREFNVRVWAVDLWFSPSENRQRIHDSGCSEVIFPIHADARSLPFATEFFDAIVSIDAFPYFGTDDHYLRYLARFVKPNGIIAMAAAGFMEEFDEIPTHLSEWMSREPMLKSMHSPGWWRRHWINSGAVEVERADSMAEGWRLWLKWHQAIAPDNHLEIQTVEADAGRYLGYNRIVARRRADVVLDDPIESIPITYCFQPLLRDRRQSS